MIRLDEAAIERALPHVTDGLESYCRIQKDLTTTDVSCDRGFQRRFNAFYRVRRNADWRSAFYSLLERQKVGPQPFAEVLRALSSATGRVEASFASKLVASVDPCKPVIDSYVLRNVGFSLLRYGTVEARLARCVEVYGNLGERFAEFLATEQGRYLVARFEECYPHRQLTPVKMLDLVLWKTRR
jgi:hypothetical protein